MRKCLRCGAEMKDGYALYDGENHYQVKIGKPGRLFPKVISKLVCAVCPECGYVELYMEDTSKVEKG